MSSLSLSSSSCSGGQQRLPLVVRKILVAGDRYYDKENVIERELRKYNPNTTLLIHGACVGADMLADKVARRLGWIHIKSYPVDWSQRIWRKGPQRNARMLREQQPDEVIIFHPNLHHSKGSLDMFNKASKYVATRPGCVVRLIVD